MKGSSSVLVFLLLLCVFSSGCMELEMAGLGWIFDVQEPVGTVCTSPLSKVARSAGLDQDHCYQQVAVNTANPALCEKVNREPPMTKCYLLIAAKQNDLSICDQIPPATDMQSYLKIDCLWEVAMKNNNPAACEAMGEQKISRMFVGEMSRQTCSQRLASGQAATGGLT